MAPKNCPACNGNEFETDQTLGQVVCALCGTIVERGILVSEVGFAEASGGRMHVTGTFVSNYSTGIAGFRGKDSGQSSQAVKQAGQEKIQQVAREMGLGAGISNGATRSFSLVVDQRFNKGRRTDYLVASCLYLQCRLMKEPYMLIDFSERLQVNVFELAGTYLKLRTNLHLDKTMPEVDPAIYNIHFARRLELGPHAQRVAADASRLVRRFKADWMTQGRRPAGICGACLIIASRMSNYLRTPEEVGQVVKCSAYTIRKRLREFAVTEMAQKTVKEWRGLTEGELDEVRGEEPPIVRWNRLRKEREERERQRGQENERERQQEADAEEEEEEEAEEDDGDDEGEEGEGSEAEDVGGEETQSPSGKKRKRSGKNVNGKGKTKAKVKATTQPKGKGKKRQKRLSTGSVDPEDAVRIAVAEAMEAETEDAGIPEDDEQGGEAAHEEDRDLDNLMGHDMADDLDAAGDDPEEARRARKVERMAFQRQNRALTKALLQPAQEEEEDELGGENEKEDAAIQEEDGLGADEEEGLGEKEEGLSSQPEATQLRQINFQDQVRFPPTSIIPKPDQFDGWNDPQMTLQHFQESYFASDPRFASLDPGHIRDRIQKWLNNDRDPKVVAWELQVVDMAYKRRDYQARESKNETLDDLDEDELEEYYVLDEKDKQLRARVWLSQNGKWLEQNRLKEEERAAYNKAHGIDPNKPKPKRKRNTGPQLPGRPYTSTREAMEGLAAQKKFSSRINYGALGGMGGYEVEDLGAIGLQRMDDEKEDDEFTNYAGGPLAGLVGTGEDGKEDEEEDEDAYW